MSAMRPSIVVADSVTTLHARHSDAVVVSGSHGGLIAARYAVAAGVRAAVFNDAGIGLDESGIAGLAALHSIGMAAVAVSHRSARIGDGDDTLASGVVSRANPTASSCGVAAGMPCRAAAELLRDAPTYVRPSDSSFASEGRRLLRAASGGSPAILAIDSIGLVVPSDTQAILVIGSHGGLHGGDPGTALGVDAHAAFFHDAGRGKDDAGVTRLPVLAQRGIPAGAVDHRTARIGDAQSMWNSGVLSCVNALLAASAVQPGMSLAEAVARLRTTS
jgi:hypothetical protein